MLFDDFKFIFIKNALVLVQSVCTKKKLGKKLTF